MASSEDLRAAFPFTAVQKCCVRATRQVQADSKVTRQGARIISLSAAIETPGHTVCGM